jgi:2-polyprenyl-6-methoxyphenol hydroxylase-like FAD-dependent oxidoreductase
MRRLVAGISGRHVEVMRGELAAILYEATQTTRSTCSRTRTHMVEEPDGIGVTFEHAAADRFDLVIGADGLHSIVRRLTFGPEDQFRRSLSGYLAGAALPNYLGLDARMVLWTLQGGARRSTPFTRRPRPGEASSPQRGVCTRFPRRRWAEASAAPSLWKGWVAGSSAAGRHGRR